MKSTKILHIESPEYVNLNKIENGNSGFLKRQQPDQRAYFKHP